MLCGWTLALSTGGNDLLAGFAPGFSSATILCCGWHQGMQLPLQLPKGRQASHNALSHTALKSAQIPHVPMAQVSEARQGRSGCGSAQRSEAWPGLAWPYTLNP